MTQNRLVRAALIATGLALLANGGSLGWLKYHEDDIIFATARTRDHILTTLPEHAQRTAVPLLDGVELAAITFTADPDADTGFWILHLHGNADSAFSPWQTRHCELLREAGFNVLAIDYRGYGPSPGRASEKAMYADSEAAYQDLLRRGVPEEHIIIWGHSLGTGPAVVLATQHKAAALVLFAAFTSMPDAAAFRYPYLPVRMLTGVQFDSIDKIASVHMPIVIAHSRADTVIPYAQGLRLYAAANEPKRLLSFDARSDEHFGGHVDALYDHLDILKSALAELLPALPGKPAP